MSPLPSSWGRGKNPVERLLGQLHQAHGIGVGAGLGVKAAFRLDDGVDQVGLQVELRGLPLHQLRVALGIEQPQAALQQPRPKEDHHHGHSHRQHCQGKTTSLHRRVFSSSWFRKCSTASSTWAPGPFFTTKSARAV